MDLLGTIGILFLHVEHISSTFRAGFPLLLERHTCAKCTRNVRETYAKGRTYIPFLGSMSFFYLCLLFSGSFEYPLMKLVYTDPLISTPASPSDPIYCNRRKKQLHKIMEIFLFCSLKRQDLKYTFLPLNICPSHLPRPENSSNYHYFFAVLSIIFLLFKAIKIMWYWNQVFEKHYCIFVQITALEKHFLDMP